MRVCENGHFVGDAKAKKCPTCSDRVGDGHKVSLFLPDALHKALSIDARTMSESISAQIVRHVNRDRDRKRPRTKVRSNAKRSVTP